MFFYTSITCNITALDCNTEEEYHLAIQMYHSLCQHQLGLLGSTTSLHHTHKHKIILFSSIIRSMLFGDSHTRTHTHLILNVTMTSFTFTLIERIRGAITVNKTRMQYGLHPTNFPEYGLRKCQQNFSFFSLPSIHPCNFHSDPSLPIAICFN